MYACSVNNRDVISLSKRRLYALLVSLIWFYTFFIYIISVEYQQCVINVNIIFYNETKNGNSYK